MNKAEIRREIEKRSSSYTDEELFGSPYFNQIMQSVVTSMCEGLKRIPKITVKYKPTSDETSSTDGITITHNSASPLIRGMKDTWEKYVSNVGTGTHECLHVLYTDFKTLNPLREAWKKPVFSWYRHTPANGKEIAEYCNKNPRFKAVYSKELCDMVNILEDMYIENIGYQKYGGLCTAGISLKNKEKYNLSMSEEEMLNYYLEGKITPGTIANCILQIRELGFTPKTGEIPEDGEEVRDNVYAFLDKAEPYINIAVMNSDSSQRLKAFNEIAALMFDLYDKNEDEDSDDQNSGSGNGDGEELPEELKQLLNSISSVLAENGVTEEAQGSTRPVDSVEMDSEKIEDGKANSEQLAKSEDSMKNYTEKAKEDVAKQEVLEEDEKQHEESLQQEANQIQKTNEKSSMIGHSDFKSYKIERESEFDKELYDEIYSKIASDSKSLVRKISSILKERKTEGYDSGYLMGVRFNPQDVYHGDGKYFSREVVPDGQPNVAFGILVDESGSMSWGNYERAREAAILLEDALRNLNIPLLLCGHDETWDTVNIYNYVDFDTNDGKDRYRLSNIDARSGNIDGAAITYIGDKLLKRPEEIKVLIVISDGEPAGSSFYSSNSNQDTIMAIEKYRKKGIKIFGAVVDEFENVSRLYGEKYSFDCTSGDSLQRELVKIVKKYILLT